MASSATVISNIINKKSSLVDFIKKRDNFVVICLLWFVIVVTLEMLSVERVTSELVVKKGKGKRHSHFQIMGCIRRQRLISRAGIVARMGKYVVQTVPIDTLVTYLECAEGSLPGYERFGRRYANTRGTIVEETPRVCVSCMR